MLHEKLGLKKYFRTFAIVEKQRPDLLKLKSQIENLPVQEDLDSLERAKYLRRAACNPNIYAFLKERQSSAESSEQRKDSRVEFVRSRKLKFQPNFNENAMKLLETQENDSYETIVEDSSKKIDSSKKRRLKLNKKRTSNEDSIFDESSINNKQSPLL